VRAAANIVLWPNAALRLMTEAVPAPAGGSPLTGLLQQRHQRVADESDPRWLFDRRAWRMPLEGLPPVTWTTQKVALLAVRGCLVAAILLLVLNVVCLTRARSPTSGGRECHLRRRYHATKETTWRTRLSGCSPTRWRSSAR
jgi:hypothetical protein